MKNYILLFFLFFIGSFSLNAQEKNAVKTTGKIMKKTSSGKDENCNFNGAGGGTENPSNNANDQQKSSEPATNPAKEVEKIKEKVPKIKNSLNGGGGIFKP